MSFLAKFGKRLLANFGERLKTILHLLSGPSRDNTNANIRLKIKLAEWKNYFSGKDSSSIFHQLVNMLWNDAVFRVINETRSGSPVHKGKDVQVNATVHHFIDEGYWHVQATSIRRQLDPDGFEGERGVCSLVTLINEMRRERTLLTRANIFYATGLEYDLPAKKRRVDEWSRAQPLGQAYFIPKEFDTTLEEGLHAVMDRLCGGDRGRGDRGRS